MTKKKVSQILNYLTTKPNAEIRFYVSDMILNIRSNSSYLSEPRACSRVSGHFFLGETPLKGQPILLKGAIYVFFRNLKICCGLSSGS